VQVAGVPRKQHDIKGPASRHCTQ